MGKYACAGRKRKTEDGVAYCDFTAERAWTGPCPGCGNYYDIIRPTNDTKQQKATFASLGKMKPPPRISTGVLEFDQVLGNTPPSLAYGLVPGSNIVITGPPGIGKSTLLLQTANGLANSKEAEKKECAVLYTSGEQSVNDIGLVASRLDVSLSDKVVVLGNEDDMYKIVDVAMDLKPLAIVVDSLSTLIVEDAGGNAGSAEQLKNAAQYLTSFCKSKEIASFLVMHVTKDLMLSGPKAVEHLVDAIVYFDNYAQIDEDGNVEPGTEQLRELVAPTKNRYGATGISTYLEMTANGLVTPSRRRSRLSI